MRIHEFAIKLWQSHHKGLIAVAILLIVNLALYVGLEQVVLPRVNELEKTYIQKQADVRQLMRNRGGNANTPEQRYAVASKELKSFKEYVPDYQNFTGLIEELLVLSNKAGLNISQVNYKPETYKEIKLLQYSFSFQVTGSYESIKKFVHALEQSDRLLVINQIGLSGVDGGAVSLSLSLETFFRTGQNSS